MDLVNDFFIISLCNSHFTFKNRFDHFTVYHPALLSERARSLPRKTCKHEEKIESSFADWVATGLSIQWMVLLLKSLIKVNY